MSSPDNKVSPAEATTVEDKGNNNKSTFDIYVLGLSIILGGQTTVWNYGIDGHFNEFFTSLIVTAVGYICLSLCVAEMMSALPFSGGIYGLARVALNPFVGFLVGLIETMKNIFHLACSIVLLSLIISFAFNTHSKYEPTYWFILLFSSFFINIGGNQVFWNIARLTGIFNLVVIVLFILSVIVNHNQRNFDTYALTTLQGNKIHGFEADYFFRNMVIGNCFYIGVELIPFTCVDTKEPTKTVPKAMLFCMATILLTSFGVLFAGASQFPGIFGLQQTSIPLNFGLMHMFQLSQRQASWFTIILGFTSVLGFLFGCGRQLASLSKSGLLPSYLQWKTSNHRDASPYAALFTVIIFTFGLMFLIRYQFNNNIRLLFYVAFFDCCFSNINALVTYIYFKQKYSSLKRTFVNPFGVFAAYLGIFIFLLMATEILGLQQDNSALAAPIAFSCIVGLGSLYYYVVSSKKQYYSEEEQKAFLLTYVINSNTRGRNKQKKPAPIVPYKPKPKPQDQHEKLPSNNDIKPPVAELIVKDIETANNNTPNNQEFDKLLNDNEPDSLIDFVQLPSAKIMHEEAVRLSQKNPSFGAVPTLFSTPSKQQTAIQQSNKNNKILQNNVVLPQDDNMVEMIRPAQNV